MSRMPGETVTVIGGVDTHADFHYAAAIDAQGRLLGSQPFRATGEGYQLLLAWTRQFGAIQAIGVEGTGAYGAALTRSLQQAGVTAVEVNRPHAHLRSRKGKSDKIDAEAAARKVLAGECTAIPKDTTGVVEAIRQLHLARGSAVHARTIALQQIDALTVTASPELRQELAGKTLKAKARHCATWAPDPAHLTDPAAAVKHTLGHLARRVQDLNNEIGSYDKSLSTLVTTVAPNLRSRYCVGVLSAAQMLITAGQNISRLRSESAFAHLCGASPVLASSGKTERHRLNPGGDRQANRALYIIALVRLHYCPRTRAYAERRTAEGKSKKEIIRCLKRYIAREIYKALTRDLGNLGPTA